MSEVLSEPLHVIGYVRVSTEEQVDSRLGIEAQIDAIESQCARRGWTVEMRVDAGCSGKNVNAQLRESLDLLAARRADALVVAKLDRLARSVGHAVDIMDRAERQGWRLVVLDVDVDLGTPAGKAMAGMLAIFAQFERELISTRIKEALAAKARRGEHIGRTSAVPSSVVRRIVVAREGGASFRAIAAELTADDVLTPSGLSEWQESTVRRTYAATTREAVA